MRDQVSKAEALRARHGGDAPLVLPNIWDAGTSVLAAEAGFEAIATTSAGVAWAHGLPDGEVISREDMLNAVAACASAVDIPVTADMETGYGEAPETVADTVKLTAEAGAAGLNLEDGIEHSGEILEKSLAVDRIAAARAAADEIGIPMVINARTDIYFGNIRGPDEKFDIAVERANAYLAAGADCAYVIAVMDADAIGELAKAIDGPLNVPAGAGGLDVAGLAALGVARISVAGGLTRGAFGYLRRVLAELKNDGTFGFLDGAIPHPELNQLYAMNRGDQT